MKVKVKDKFCYLDKEDFELFSQYNWKINSRGKDSKTFYLETINNKKHLSFHRLLFNLTDRKLIVDHINHNGLDNRKVNLRVCSHKENRSNNSNYTFKNKKKSSKYKGVTWDKERDLWMAKIRNWYKTIFLGRFKTQKQAAIAYDQAARKLFGKYSNPNFKE